MSELLAILAGLAMGLLSSWGIGGGTLLVLYMTLFVHIPQVQAQGINLLYFLPVAVGALQHYFRKGLIDIPVWRTASLAGCFTALVSAYAAQFVDNTVLRQLFGGLLLILGGRELLRAFGKRTDNERG